MSSAAAAAAIAAAVQEHLHLHQPLASISDKLTMSQSEQPNVMDELRSAGLNDLYMPLDASLGQIRLLHLHPGDGVIRCTLETIALRDNSEFVALSYTWGIVMSERSIELQGRAGVSVTENLYVALLHLRHPTDLVKLWVDAICINQEDNEEKSKQLLLMKDIYSAAEETCIWLGPSADNSDLAMAEIDRCFRDQIYEISEAGFTTDALAAIGALQHRDWWYRTWVIQEALLSRSPSVHCGNVTVPLDAFVQLDDLRRGYFRPQSRWLDTGSRQTGNVIASNPFRNILTDFSDFKTKIASGRSNLAEWTYLLNEFYAKDPRDKIYGLLGLGSTSDLNFLAPDYEASVADVYTRATARFLIQMQELFLLQFDVEGKNPDLNLPTWVPDYSADPDHRPRNYIPFTSGIGVDKYCASGRSCWGLSRFPVSALFPNDWSELHLRGLHFDRIEYVSPGIYVASYTGYHPAERLENIKARAEQTRVKVLEWEEKTLERWAMASSPYEGATGNEAFWRACMADRTFNHERVPSAYSEYFETWADRSEVPAAYFAEHADLDAAEAKRIYVKPFTDCCISRAHSRSFVMTKRGYIGLAPMGVQAGDIVSVLMGSPVPSILRQCPPSEAPTVITRLPGTHEEPIRCTFIGEAFIYGIMEGQAVSTAEETNVRHFVLV